MTGQVVYDADCGFCSRSAHWMDGHPVTWQSLDLARVGATQEQADAAAGWLVDGAIRALGAPAIAAALVARGGWTRPIGRFLDLPGVRALAGLCYRLVATHRHRLPGGTPTCRPEDRPGASHG